MGSEPTFSKSNLGGRTHLNRKRRNIGDSGSHLLGKKHCLALEDQDRLRRGKKTKAPERIERNGRRRMVSGSLFSNEGRQGGKGEGNEAEEESRSGPRRRSIMKSLATGEYESGEESKLSLLL